MSREIRTEKEFNDILGTGKKMLVLFYSGWCPYCRAFLPVFEAHCKGDAGTHCFVEVNELESLEDAYQVEVVPTVLCFDNGKLAARLDGVPGRGLTEKQLLDFARSCNLNK